MIINSSITKRGIGILVAFTLSFLIVISVSAHEAEVIKSDPPANAVLTTAPGKVTAWFSEELETGSSTIEVLNNNGERVDLGDGGVDLYDPDHASMFVSLKPSLPDDAYLVHWNITLTDGDASEGAFPFYIGKEVPLSAQLSTLLVVPAVADSAAASLSSVDTNAAAAQASVMGGNSTTLILVGILIVIALVVAAVVAMTFRRQRANKS